LGWKNSKNSQIFSNHVDLLGDDHVPTTVTAYIKKESERPEISHSPGARQIYQSPSMSVSIHEVPVSSMGQQQHQHQHHNQQRDHGITANLNVLAALSNNGHINLHNQHPHLSFSSGDQHPQRGHGHSSMINPTANEKAIAQAIATVGGNYPNHSPPPYPVVGDNQSSSGPGSGSQNPSNNNSGGHSNGSNANGGHGGYVLNVSSPPLRYLYTSNGRHQQVIKGGFDSL